MKLSTHVSNAWTKQTSLSTLPSELLFEIIELLPPPSQLSVRILNRRFNSFTCCNLDRVLFRSARVRTTTGSLNGLLALSTHPVLSGYVEQLVYDPARLRAFPFFDLFRREQPQLSRTAYAEYQKAYWEQTRLLDSSVVEALVAAMARLPALRTVTVDTQPGWALRPRELDVGATPRLDKLPDLAAFREQDPAALVEHNTFAFCALATAAARAQARITRAETRVGILDKVVCRDTFSLDEIAAGLAGCAELAVMLDNASWKGNGPYSAHRGAGSPVAVFAGAVMPRMLAGAATALRTLDVSFVGKKDLKGFALFRCPDLADVFPLDSFPALESLRLAGVEMRAEDLAASLRRCGTLKTLSLRNMLLETGYGGWRYLMDEVRNMTEMASAGGGFELQLSGELYTVEMDAVAGWSAEYRVLRGNDLGKMMAYVNAGGEAFPPSR